MNYESYCSHSLNKKSSSSEGNLPDEKLEFHSYPNPLVESNYLKIQSEKEDLLRYKIYTTLGKSVVQKGMKSTLGNKTAKIDVTNLQPGIYYLVVNNSNIQRTTKKFFVVK